MRHDVFYIGNKPNSHPRETQVETLEEARQLASSDHFWLINSYTDYTDFDWEFDFDLLPDEDVWAKEFINAWPSQHQKDGGTWLCPKEKTEIIVYRNNVTPLKRKNEINEHWDPAGYTPLTFDFSWHPDSSEPPFIYQFGTQHQKTGGPKFYSKNATDIKYTDAMKAVSEVDMTNWTVTEGIILDDFDFSWHPDSTEEPYIYVWGNQWNDCYTEPTVTYTTPGATAYKYITTTCARVKSTEQEEHWEIIIPVTNFDFSWRPNPNDPPYIYVFGNKFNDSETEPTVLYHTKGATEYKFVNTIVASTVANMALWQIRNELDRTLFDFSWRPNPKHNPSNYSWGTDGPIYNMDSENTIEIEYDRTTLSERVEEQTVIEKVVLRSMFYVDRGNPGSTEKYQKLKEQFPQLQKTRYLLSWVDTISRCLIKSGTELFWVLNSDMDYSDFTFDYNPNPWQTKMVHVFGTQWSHWGNTYLVNKNTFSEDTKYVKVIEHLNMLNFVKDKRTKINDCLHDIILVDHGNSSTESVKELLLQKTNRSVTVVKYEQSYLNTFKSMLSMLKGQREHYVWVCSTICDYSLFDFTYIPDPYAKQQLHVFPSGKQQYGDTFLIDVNKLREGITEIDSLGDFDKVNYNRHQSVARLSCPVFTVEDSQTELVNFDYEFPYAVFQTDEQVDTTIEPLNVWDMDKADIVVANKGASRIIVPKTAKDYIKGDVYDYLYIDTKNMDETKPMDIVFLSNGEERADEHYERLLEVSKKFNNRVVRVDGVNGRANAYHAAAKASNTPWFFSVFAKLEVDKRFDFEWQPDRLQERKHYIFHARNPVNGLVYGHQAMIAYNKKLVLSNPGIGLDFTLDSLHEVVKIVSGVARFDTDEYSTWRTSFRECVKLKDTVVHNPDDEVSVQRLKTWATVGNGQYGQDSINGALDAIEYYDSVNGDMDKLKLTYEWEWLKNYYNNKYSYV